MPVGAGLAISGAATLGSGALQANASSKATSAAEQAQANTLAWEKQVYGQTSAELQPTISQGTAAGNELAGLLGTGGNAAQSQQAFNTYLGSTNYQFQLGQGLQGIEYANAPAFSSSATAKALNNYAQGQAGNALSGYESLLSGQQSLGAQSALGLGQVGVGAGSTINSANQAAAGTIGSAAVYGANSGQNALSGLASLANQGITQSSFGSGGSSAIPADLQGLV
jgi:hypothetical protein